MRLAVNSRLYAEKGTGISNYIRDLYGALLPMAEKRHEVVFIQQQDKVTLGKTIIVPGSESRLDALLFDVLRFGQAAKGATIIHATSFGIPIWPFFKGRRVVTIHDLSFMTNPASSDLVSRLYFKGLVTLAVRRADKLLYYSQQTRHDLEKLFAVAPDRMCYAPLGAAPLFEVQPAQPAFYQGEYCLSVTTHPRRKNIFAALEAFSKLSGHEKLMYCIAGKMSAEYQDELRAKAQEFGIADKVVLLGFVDDLQLLSLYQHARCLIYPSFYEGFGIPILEAVFSNCPVITSNVSSMPELLPNQDWLVDPYSVPSIAEKLQVILDLSPADRKKVLATNLAFAQQFSWKRCAEATLACFESLV